MDLKLSAYQIRLAQNYKWLDLQSEFIFNGAQIIDPYFHMFF